MHCQHTIFLFKVPVGVLKRLEAIRSKFFRGVDVDSRKIAWFSWDKVIASKEVGGLGMSNFYAMNRALLFKWIWRFKTQTDALWVLVIKAIHGACGNLDRDIQVGKSSPLLECIRSMGHLKTKGVDLLSCITKMVGNGSATSFWLETWTEIGVFKEKFPRLFALEENKEITIFEKFQNGVTSSFRRMPRGGAESVQMEELTNMVNSVTLPEGLDRWSWSLVGDGEFSVASARKHIDESLYLLEGTPTRWSKLVPIKVNILAWRIALNKLPSRFNMSLRGLKIPSMEYLILFYYLFIFIFLGGWVGNHKPSVLLFDCF